MRAIRLPIGAPASPDMVGAVLARDLRVGDDRWRKGRRLSTEDLRILAAARDIPTPAITVLVLEPDEVHEDEAACLLAEAIRGAGLTVRGPAESRVDLVAEAAGVVHVKPAALERLDRIDPLAVFTVFDGQAVAPGDLVASVKVGPHAVARPTLDAGLAVARSARPLVRVAPYVPRSVGAIVKESIAGAARDRFEKNARAKVESLGSRLVGFSYVPDEPQAVLDAFRRLLGDVDLIATAGGRSTDPADPFYLAVNALRGRVVRHGVPAHPGSMVWLARIGRVDVIGLPSCGAYSKATAADLLLPRLLSGERASSAMAASLGHGGILTRSMRFRFPPYARELDPPEG